ncbi:MAG: sigma 54-interacting transcriptional regulator [Gracilibacteraceae bacterium]|jgi:transcriptional regulator of acetoin/glycerol metabolism|nr:sigma 54-interacting transcriptional regulator [Gracilibacteraceae bacterium]
MLSSIILSSEKFLTSREIQTEDNVYIERVKQLKLEILKGVADPAAVGLVLPEISESWLRSRRYGIEAQRPAKDAASIPKEEIEGLLLKNRFLINAALSSVRQFSALLTVNYDIFLFDPGGVNLITIFGKNNYIGYEGYGLAPGVIWNERTIGTSSMSLVPLLKRPIQCVGPENYLEDFHVATGSSAPIFGIKGELTGIFSIGTVFYQGVNSLTLTLAVSIAALIQKEFQVTLYEEMYRASSEATGELMITVDNQGFVTYANQAASQAFQPWESDLPGKPLRSLIGNQPRLEKALRSGKTLQLPEMKTPRLGVMPCSVQPFKDHHGSLIGGLVVLNRGDFRVTTPPKEVFNDIIGESAVLQKTVALAKRFVSSDAAVLLQGESGTGKELFARALQQASRPGRPFVPVNCGAIPKSLAESEFLGYEGGAFTGAEHKGRKGKIENAAGGTLFLDEIGDLPVELQPILLRVLEEKQIVRIGGSQPIAVDFRLIAATNQDLLQLMRQGLFREDLYYRLAVFKIEIPPLRERGRDVLLLAEYFLRQAAAKSGRAPKVLSRAAKTLFLSCDWPGNVRQLANSLTYAMSVAPGGVIRPEHLPAEILPRQTGNIAAATQAARALREALAQAGGDMAVCAGDLGISRATLYRRLKKYGISATLQENL